MLSFLKEYWFLISGLLIPVLSYFIGKYKLKVKRLNIANKKQDEDIDLIKSGLCAMLRQCLYNAFESYESRGYCPFEAKETLSELYKMYHLLGGNSFITAMYHKCLELPNHK